MIIYLNDKNANNKGMNVREIRRHNLKQLIKQSGLKLYEFAEKVQSSSSTISQYTSETSNKFMGHDLARRIETIFNLREGYLDTLHDTEGTAPKTTPNTRNIAQGVGDSDPGVYHLDLWDSKTPLDADEVEVPVYMEVELAAGSGRTEVIERLGPKIRFSKSTLRNAGVDPKNAAVCFSSGNSMGKVVPHGAAVGIDRGFTKIIDGEIYAFEQSGMLRIKYLYRLPNGSIKVRSENSEEFPDEIITPEEMSEFRIIGFVFWVSSIRHRRS